LDGNVIHASEKVSKLKRISARSTTLVEVYKMNELLEKRARKNETKLPE
jgi:hypothetical protein